MSATVRTRLIDIAVEEFRPPTLRIYAGTLLGELEPSLVEFLVPLLTELGDGVFSHPRGNAMLRFELVTMSVDGLRSLHDSGQDTVTGFMRPRSILERHEIEVAEPWGTPTEDGLSIVVLPATVLVHDEGAALRLFGNDLQTRLVWIVGAIDVDDLLVLHHRWDAALTVCDTGANSERFRALLADFLNEIVEQQQLSVAEWVRSARLGVLLEGVGRAVE